MEAQSRSLHDSLVSMGPWTNPAIYFGIGMLLTLRAGFVYVPFMNRLFGSEPLGIEAWAMALAAAAVIVPAVALEKRWRRRSRRDAPRDA